MAPRFIRRFFRSKKNCRNATATEERYLYSQFVKLTDENAKLRLDLHEFTDQITDLRAQLAEYDFLLAHAQARAMHSAPTAFQVDERPTPLPTSPLSPTSHPTPAWIEDIWLCSESGIRCLREAERQWQEGRPDLALEIASNAISSDPFLTPCEEMRCRVFVAAALHSLGRYEESNQRLDLVLQMISCHYMFEGPQSQDIVGIAHYIQGKNLMGLEQASEAYWSFSRALSIPGYRDKTRGLQQQAVVDFACQEAADDSASATASLRPLFCRQGSVSSVSVGSTDYSVW